MAFDGYFIKNLIKEITPHLKNNRLDRIYYTKNEFIFKLQREFLVITLNDRKGFFFQTSSYDIEKHENHEFLTILKKELLGYRLESIEQVGMDRIINFNFVGSDLILGITKKTLVLESFGRNYNLILVHDDKIIDAYKRIYDLNNRTVLPNSLYEKTTTNKLIYPKNYDLLKGRNLSENYQGISNLLANYLNDTGIKDIDSIKVDPVKNEKTNQFYWFNLFDGKVKHYPTLSLLIQDLKVKKGPNKKVYENFIRQELKKLNQKEINLRKDYDRHKNNYKLKDVADKIYMSGKDLTKYYSDFEGFNLDINKTLNENAQHFYNLYKKAQHSFRPIEDQLKKTAQEREIFNNYLKYLKTADDNDLDTLKHELYDYGFRLRKKQQPKVDPESKVLEFKYKNSTILVGKNSNQNKYLVTKLANKDDMWLHVKAASGSHVIIKGDHSFDVIKKAAQYAAFYSTLKFSSQIPVDYTLVRYVSKIRKSSTFKVTYKNYKTLFLNNVSKEDLSDH